MLGRPTADQSENKDEDDSNDPDYNFFDDKEIVDGYEWRLDKTTKVSSALNTHFKQHIRNLTWISCGNWKQFIILEKELHGLLSDLLDNEDNDDPPTYINDNFVDESRQCSPVPVKNNSKTTYDTGQLNNEEESKLILNNLPSTSKVVEENSKTSNNNNDGENDELVIVIDKEGWKFKFL